MPYKRLLGGADPAQTSLPNLLSDQISGRDSLDMMNFTDSSSSNRNRLLLNGMMFPPLVSKPQYNMPTVHSFLPNLNSFPGNNWTLTAGSEGMASPATPVMMEKNWMERRNDLLLLPPEIIDVVDDEESYGEVVVQKQNEPIRSYEDFRKQNESITLQQSIVDGRVSSLQQEAEGMNNVVINSGKENQGIDLNKTPQQKPKRKKFTPKVIREGKPKRAPKRTAAIPKTAGTTTPNPTRKRKYVRKKKDLNPEETPRPSTSTRPVEQTVDADSRSRRSKAVRRSLNFDLAGTQVIDRSLFGQNGSQIHTQAQEDREEAHAAVETGESSSQREGLVDLENSLGCGVGFDLNSWTNQPAHEMMTVRIPPQTPNHPSHEPCRHYETAQAIFQFEFRRMVSKLNSSLEFERRGNGEMLKDATLQQSIEDGRVSSLQQEAEGMNNVVINSGIENQGIDLNKTPQQKPKRKKFTPKVIREGKPKRAPKRAAAIPKTAGTTTPNPMRKRKYVRKKKDLNPEETPRPSTSTRPVEQTADADSRSRRSKAVRRSLNFDLAGTQVIDRSLFGQNGSQIHTQAQEDREEAHAAVETGESSSQREGLVDLENSLGCGVGFDLNSSTNQLAHEMMTVRIPPQTPNHPSHEPCRHYETAQAIFRFEFRRMVSKLNSSLESERRGNGEMLKDATRGIADTHENGNLVPEAADLHLKGAKRTHTLVDSSQVSSCPSIIMRSFSRTDWVNENSIINASSSSSSTNPCLGEKINKERRTETGHKECTCKSPTLLTYNPCIGRKNNDSAGSISQVNTSGDAQRLIANEKSQALERMLTYNQAQKDKNKRVQNQSLTFLRHLSDSHNKVSTPTATSNHYKLDFNQPKTPYKVPILISNGNQESEIHGPQARVDVIIANQKKKPQPRGRKKKEQIPVVNANSSQIQQVSQVFKYSQKETKFKQFPAFLKAWKLACSVRSVSILTVPARKTYLIKPITFSGPCKSMLTLLILGTIIAPSDPRTWDRRDPHKWLYFVMIKDLVVTGGGTINGMGQQWWASSCKRNASNPCGHAPTAITFHRITRLIVQDLTLLNSQQMHMTFTMCSLVRASHLRVISPAWSPNTDGIHISSSNSIMIEESLIRTGDDCISIVGDTSDVFLRNIFCGPGHSISIGSLGKSNSSARVQNIHVEGAFLSDTENGVRIKTWQGGHGYAHNILFTDIMMNNVSNPIIIDQYYCDSNKPCQNQTAAVQVYNIAYIGIKGTSATENTVKFASSDTFPCENLFLEDIQLSLDSGEDSTTCCWEALSSDSDLVYPPRLVCPVLIAL